MKTREEIRTLVEKDGYKSSSSSAIVNFIDKEVMIEAIYRAQVEEKEE